jgi:hypothetical protein
LLLTSVFLLGDTSVEVIEDDAETILAAPAAGKSTGGGDDGTLFGLGGAEALRFMAAAFPADTFVCLEFAFGAIPLRAVVGADVFGA